MSEPNIPEARRAMSIDFFVKDLVPDYLQLIPQSEWGVNRQAEGLKDGVHAVLLRMLPEKTRMKKRADCHIWPKGTFLQINGSRIRLDQRKQQSHAPDEWKNPACKHLDLTICINDPTRRVHLDMCCYDEEPFMFCIAVCKFKSQDVLYNELTDFGRPGAITYISRQESLENASILCQQNTIDLERSNGQGEEVKKFVFQLTCPFTKTLMEKPVRGKFCKHWQVSCAAKMLNAITLLFPRFLFDLS